MKTKLEIVTEEIERIRPLCSNYRIKVKRVLPTEEGNFEISLEADLENSSPLDREVSLTLLALEAEQAVIRHAFSAGALAKGIAKDRDQAARTGFANSITNLLSKILAEKS